MRVVVTGASGFIGSHLVNALRELDVSVMAVDILPQRPGLLLGPGSQYVRMDLMRDPWPSFDFASIDVVYHLAAAPWIVSTEDDRIRVNVYGTLRALQLSKEYGAVFVLASSGQVYGPPQESPIPESHRLAPIAPYGWSKLLAEYLCAYFRPDVEARILRFGNVYGPGQLGQVVPDIITKALNLAESEPLRLYGMMSEPLRLYGTGDETRDFVYVQDAVDALLRMLTPSPAGSFVRGSWDQIFNVGTGAAHSVREVSSTILTLLDQSGRSVEFSGERRNLNDGADGLPIALDVGRLRSKGWSPSVGFEQGLRETVGWWKHRGGL